MTADGRPLGAGAALGAFVWEPVPDDGCWRHLAGFCSGGVVRELVRHLHQEAWGIRRTDGKGNAVIVVRGSSEEIEDIWHRIQRAILPRRWRDEGLPPAPSPCGAGRVLAGK
ncbi:hypothetical protein AB0K60_07310 [Thermopolyspora sp. NPDC052614]|uniref:hypothetical protein n=1 Tax=Thermopolyspora sp. NPDC052614 TaxID=3155682 RepID=UPI00342E0C2E